MKSIAARRLARTGLIGAPVPTWVLVGEGIELAYRLYRAVRDFQEDKSRGRL